MLENYEIRTEDGAVANTIIADEAFVEAFYPGRFTLISEIAEPTPVAPALPELSPRQIRRGLGSIGITEDQVEALLIQLPDADDALIDWRYANSYRRDHPLVGALITAFQLTEAEVDTLWLWAAGL